MKFNFNLKGRQSANARYSFVKAAALPDTQWDLFKTLMAASLMIDDAGQAALGHLAEVVDIDCAIHIHGCVSIKRRFVPDDP